MAWDTGAIDKVSGMTVQTFSLRGEFNLRLYEDEDAVSSASLDDAGDVLDIVGEALRAVLHQITQAREKARVGRPHEDLSRLDRQLEHDIALLRRARDLLADTPPKENA